MNVAGIVVRDQTPELGEHPKQTVAGTLAVRFDGFEVNEFGIRVRRDHLGRGLRDHPEVGLSLGQGDLHIEPPLISGGL